MYIKRKNNFVVNGLKNKDWKTNADGYSSLKIPFEKFFEALTSPVKDETVNSFLINVLKHNDIICSETKDVFHIFSIGQNDDANSVYTALKFFVPSVVGEEDVKIYFCIVNKNGKDLTVGTASTEYYLLLVGEYFETKFDIAFNENEIVKK